MVNSMVYLQTKVGTSGFIKVRGKFVYAAYDTVI